MELPVSRSALGAGFLIATNFLGAPSVDEPSSGFNLCVAPRPPDCVDASQAPGPVEDCERRVQAYVARVFRYRECLEAETERQVRRANETLDKWKCKQSKKCR